MTARPPSVGVPADQTSFLTFGDRETARELVGNHIAAKRPVEELGIEPNRPVDLHDFAYVGSTPKRSSQASWYRCSFCQTGRKFAQGRIVLSSDHRLRLIGDDCWNKHLDPKRHELELQDWKDYNTKKRFARIRHLLTPEVVEQASGVRTYLSNGQLSFVEAENLADFVKQQVPLLFEHLMAAHQRGGELQKDRRIRDYSAEERTDSPRFITVSETVHRLRGLAPIVTPVKNLKDACEKTLRSLYKVKSYLEGARWAAAPNRQSVLLMKSVERDVRAAIESFSPVSSAVQGIAEFFARDNLSGLVRWSVDQDCEPLELVADGVSFISARGELAVLAKPRNLNEALLPDLRKLTRILSIE